MRSPEIVVFEISPQVFGYSLAAGEVAGIDQFGLHGSPEPLDEHVVERTAAPGHADLQVRRKDYWATIPCTVNGSPVTFPSGCRLAPVTRKNTTRPRAESTTYRY